MSVTRATLVALMLSCLACAAVADARDILQRHHEDKESEEKAEPATATDSESGNGCSAPPDGDWIVRHNFPSMPGNNTLSQQARSILSLRRVIDNVYQGFGGGVASTPEVAPLLPGIPIDFQFIAIWSPETCTLSGVLYSFEQLLTDPLALTYDGETLTGPYANTVNSTVLFSRTGILSLSLFYPYE